MLTTRPTTTTVEVTADATVTTVTTVQPRSYPRDYCLTSHVGGYGDCILQPGHVSAHQDAHGYVFRDEDNARIMASRLALRSDQRTDLSTRWLSPAQYPPPPAPRH